MDIKQFYDVNKRTQTEQVLKNQEDIDALKDKDTDIEQSIDDEANARVQADESLAYDIAELQNQINSFGNVFTLKGSVATYNDLPVTDNHIGDVWYVEANAVGYVWIDDNGTQRWEQLGLPIDLSDYVTTSDLALALEDYQEKLTAGTNISIIDNVISSAGGTPANMMTTDADTQTIAGGNTKTLKFTAGADNTGLKITSNEQSAKYVAITPANTNLFSNPEIAIGLGTGSGASGIYRTSYRADGIKLSTGSGNFWKTLTLKFPNVSETGEKTIALTSDIKKYYAHYLRFTFSLSGSTIVGNLQIITSQSTAFTRQTLADYLYNNGFTNVNAINLSLAGVSVYSAGTEYKTITSTNIYASSNVVISILCVFNIITFQDNNLNVVSTNGIVNDTSITLNDIVVEL